MLLSVISGFNRASFEKRKEGNFLKNDMHLKLESRNMGEG